MTHLVFRRRTSPTPQIHLIRISSSEIRPKSPNPIPPIDQTCAVNDRFPNPNRISRSTRVVLSDPRKMNYLANKPSTECGNCSFKDRWLLHYVRLRGEHRRLCTSCVLKLHPGSFCSICFELLEGSVAQHERVICQKCPSIAHPGCVPNSANVVAKNYICPPCSDPKFVYFDAKRNSDMRFEIDLKKSKVLLCAARIAAESMSRAVHVAEADAHRRVKEATVSRKRAKEALEEICASVAREKARKLREEDRHAVGSANGVGSSTRDRMIMGGSAAVPGSSSNVGVQNRASSQDVVLVSGGNLSNIMLSEDKRGKTSNGDAGRSVLAGNIAPANSMNVDNVGNADGKHGSSSSRPAEDGK